MILLLLVTNVLTKGHKMLSESKIIRKKLAKAKENLKEVTKDTKNPFFKSNFADLNTHLDLINPELEKVGLDMSQPTMDINGASSVTTVITDKETGEAIVVSSLQIPALQDPQKILACITYFRRGMLNSLFNLKSVDDDGETAAGRGKANTTSKVETVTPAKMKTSFAQASAPTTTTANKAF